MHSFASTFLLAMLAVLALGLAALQWQDGGFDMLFGKPATPVDEPLYQGFKAQDVAHIRVTTSGGSASFSLNENGWHAEHPWNDRMDPMAAVAIIQFTLGMRVEDHAPAGKVDGMKSGLDRSAVEILLEDSSRQTLAHYKMGRLSPWTAENKDTGEALPTLFIKPQDTGRNRHAYICTGDITPLFKDGLRYLRDHRPLYFNPLALESINIHSAQGDLTLGRESPQAPWRITKPLELPTDPQSIRNLLEGLYKLRAMKVSDRNEVTLPTTTATGGSTQISIKAFGSKTATTLEVFPADSFDTPSAKAVVSDRPLAVFDLPLKPNPDLISIADLPIDVNSLRDPTLTHLQVGSVSAIRIIPSTGSEILVSRQAPEPWKVTAEGKTHEANEENLFKLLMSVTRGRAIGFESDAATDFSPWGLDRPLLRLIFTATNNESFELRFGMNLKGDTFVNRAGSPTVMKVEPSILRAVAIRPYEWKHSRVWSLNRVDLTDIVLKKPDQQPLLLKYTFNPEGWKASQAGEDLSPQLIPSRANFMLANLEGLKAQRWLASDDAEANAALASPQLTITAMEKTVDELGDENGFQIRTLRLAPVATGTEIGMVYGSLNTEPHPFIIDRDTYSRIITNLFEE